MKLSSFLLLLCIALALFSPGPRQAGAQTTAPSAPSCANLLANGGMEADAGWNLDDGVGPALYVQGGRSGEQALRIEAPPGADTEPQWVTAIQKVALPAGSPAELSFWYQLEAEQDVSTGQTQVALLDSEGKLLRVLLAGVERSATWRQASADLSEFAGQTVQIYFAAIAQADRGPVSLLIDDVVLCDPQSVAVASAAKPTALPATAPTRAPTIEPASLIAFRDLRVETITLTGPTDLTTVAFRLPADWEITDNATLQLDLKTVALDRDGKLLEDGPVGATLDVELNDVSLGAISLERAGDQAVSLAIPAALFAGQTAGQLQQLVFRLNGGLSCLDSDQLRLAINNSSRLLLPHTIVPIAPTLSMLPSPLVQRALGRDQATIVVADQPSAGELQAALTAAATLGRMSDGELDLDLTTIGQLADAQRAAGNLIFVGTNANLAQVSGLTLNADGAQPGDGVVSIAVSPWNPSHAVLILTGQEEAGVIKAGQAFSSDTIAAGSQGNTAIVSTVSAQPAVRRVDIDRSFELLGYDAQTLTGSGVQTLRYRFIVPSGAAVSGEAYVNLVYNHSAAIDFERSRANVALNGQPIGTMSLDEASTQLSTLRVTIPRSITRSGQNELEITAQIYPRSDCTATDDEMWLAIWAESLLHMPLNPVESAMSAGPSPNDYPTPFTFDAGLGETTIVLPKDDSAAWGTAARLLLDLGRQTQSSIINLSAHYSDTLDEATRAERNLILVGQPESLPIVAELEGRLNVATPEMEELGAAVSYRMAEANDVGRVQTIISPWNDQRMLLAVFGSSPAGLDQAAAALINPELRAQLSGNLALINNGQVIIGTTPASAEVPAGGGPPASDSSSAVDTSVPEFRRPAWIVPTIVLSALMVVAILGYVIATSVMQRRPRP
jgi:hypothetical protein